MIAFYSLYGSSRVKRLHLLRVGRERHRPSWRSDLLPMKEAWCGVAGWDCSDGAGRQVIDPAPEVPPHGLTWCPTCVGRVLESVGMLSAVGRLLAQKLAREDEADGGTVRGVDGGTGRTVAG